MRSLIPGFRLTRQIGTGAGSRLYIATELATGKQFAVKRVVRRGPEDDRFLKQVENEYDVSGRMDHPHLRKSHALHRIRKLLQVKEMLLVMELVDGLPLEKALPNRLNTFFKLFLKVASGLDALHQAGYVHTDIKPHNIMIGRKGVVKVIDFGQTCPIGHRKERIQGTPDFIAPEQVRRLRLDQRTDVFNLGATMYWVLTGNVFPTALRRQSPHGIDLVAADRPQAPIELNERLPKGLSNFVMACCNDAPADRPADMKQVIARLEVIQQAWGSRLADLRRRHAAAHAVRRDATARGNATAQGEPVPDRRKQRRADRPIGAGGRADRRPDQRGDQPVEEAP
ncbi:MAG: serine/threonine protein kinase [Phycisphaerae bacterium]